MEKRLVVTRADENIKGISKISFPLLKLYAEKCNADFMCLDHNPPFMTDDGLPHFRILKVQELLDTYYDRVLILDADMIVRQVTPDLFEMIPETHLGTIFEDVGSRQEHRRNLITEARKELGHFFPPWSKDYMNTGCAMFSKCHQYVFDPVDGKYWTGWGSDDVHIMYQIKRLNRPVYRLPFQFNHMSMFSEAWNGYADRMRSYIIHYAGKPMDERIEIMKHDLRVLEPKVYEEIFGE